MCPIALLSLSLSQVQQSRAEGAREEGQEDRQEGRGTTQEEEELDKELEREEERRGKGTVLHTTQFPKEGRGGSVQFFQSI